MPQQTTAMHPAKTPSPPDFTLPPTKQFGHPVPERSFRFGARIWLCGWLTGLLFLSSLVPALSQGYEDADVGDLVGVDFGNGLEEIKDTDYPIPTTGAYFVAPNGSDSLGNGTLENPWTTIAKAISTTGAPTGATIVLRAGTYRSDRLALRRNYTLQPYPHEKVWIKGSTVVEGWEAAGNGWRKTGWTYDFKIQNAEPARIDPGSPTAIYRDMVYVDGKSQKQVLSLAQVGPGKFFVDTQNDILYLGDDPREKMVESTIYATGFDLLVTSTVRGLGIAHYAQHAVGVFAPQCLVENNTLVWNGVLGAIAQGKGIDASRLTLRGNTFSYNGELGFAGGQAHDLLLEGNRFSYNNIELFRRSYAAAAVKIIESNRPVCRNNLVVNNNCMGIWLDLSIVDAVVTGNYVRGNQAIGIFFEVSKGIIIAGNICVKNGTGIGISGSSSAKIYNNTLDSNAIALSVKDTDRKNTVTAEIARGIDWETREVEIVNNIFANATAAATPFAMVNLEQLTPCPDTEVMISKMDHNAYHRTRASQPRNVVRYSPVAGTCNGATFTTVAEFQRAIGWEQHALVIDDEPVNPFFETSGPLAYQLKPGSPAIVAGQSLPADVAAALGWETDVNVDLGARRSDATLHRVAENPAATMPGLNYVYYPGYWNQLPDFQKLIPVKAGNVNNVDLSPRLFNHLFAFRFSGYLEVPAGGTYTFYTASDEGSRLYIGDTLVVDNSGLRKTAEQSGRIRLRAGKHAITVQYFNRFGSRELNVQYAGPGVAKQPIPDAALSRNAVASAGTGLLGTYFSQADLTGSVVKRTDPTIDFLWGVGARPASNQGRDHYSVRWTGRIEAKYSERYTFHTWSDDGIRLWVNNHLIIDHWTPHAIREDRGTVALRAGQQYDIKVEYFENQDLSLVQLLWSSASQPKETVPKSQFYAPPTAPTHVTALTKTEQSVRLGWQASDDNREVTAYEVYQGTALRSTVAGTDPTFEVTGLTPLTTYRFFVKARDGEGNASENSDTLTVTTLPDVQAPTAPANLIATAQTATSVTLSWTASVDNIGVDGYVVYADETLNSTTATTFQVTGLMAATAYRFTVKAKDAAGNASVPSAVLAHSTDPGVSLTPLADAYVRDGLATAFGTTDPASLVSKSATDGTRREVYLKFDLASVTDSIVSSKLRLYGAILDTRNTNLPVTVAGTASADWEERTLTWFDRPAVSTPPLASVVVSNTVAKYYEWDITPYIREQKAAGNQVISLAVRNTTVSTTVVQWKAKEKGSNPPQLLFVTGPETASPSLRKESPASGFKKEVAEPVSAYPNPASEQLHLRIPSEGVQSVTIELINAHARRVMHLVQTLAEGENTIALPVKHLSEGVYLVKVKRNDTRKSIKVVIAR